MSDNRKRFVQVGLGGRHGLFWYPVVVEYKDKCRMTALCDSNEGRLRLALDATEKMGGGTITGYSDRDFDRMIAEQKPDCVIVTSMDSTHDKYICRAMELGCDVITEKPMTIDEQRCRRILETKRRTGRKVTVSFNYRYAPARTQVKDLLMSGVIGEPLSVDFHWLLDTYHGADYFRRWHRNKANSGGLLVHKATHHFDLVNWWLSSVPETVYARGHRRFYTPETAEQMGLRKCGERCNGCPEAKNCRFHLDLAANKYLKPMYLDCEKHDGYFRDRCVFSPAIDIEDSMNLVVGYRNGVKMSYSLNAFCAWEGYMICFNGSKGRIEHKMEEGAYINADGTVPGALKKEGTWIRIYPLNKPAYEEKVWQAEGGHGGADPLMVKYIFEPENQPADRYKRAADERAGAWSIMTGVAANRSMKENRPVSIDELLPGIPLPDYP